MLEIREVVGIHRFRETGVKLVALALVLKNAGIGLAEHCLIEAFTEAFCSFCNLLVDLLVEFSDLVLDKHIRAITFLGILVVDQRIIKCIHVSGCFPDSRVHEDG